MATAKLPVVLLGGRMVHRDEAVIADTPAGGAVVLVTRDDHAPEDVHAWLVARGWASERGLTAPAGTRRFASLGDVCEWAPARDGSGGPRFLLRCLRVIDYPEEPAEAPGCVFSATANSFGAGVPVLGVTHGDQPDPSFHLFLRRMALQKRRWRAYLGDRQPVRASRRRRRRNAPMADDFQTFAAGSDDEDRASDAGRAADA